MTEARKRSGTYEWRLIADDAWVESILDGGRRRIVAPHASHERHREVAVLTDAPVGAAGELRYVSNFPHWGRIDFEWTKGMRR